MLSEAIHSLVDTANSVVLYYGVHMARKQPSVDHPYGYENMRYGKFKFRQDDTELTVFDSNFSRFWRGDFLPGGRSISLAWCY